MVKDRILQIQENIRRVCQKIGRDPDEITLVAVTKYSHVDDVKQAIEAGIKHIAENRVQDAQQKFAGLGVLAGSVTKHMVGHLQSNKAKDAVALFNMIQSLDSVKLAQEIEKRAAAAGIPKVEVLIEVNSGEEQKSGIAADQVMALVETVVGCPHLQLQGLMTMAPFVDDKILVRQAFADLRRLREKIAAQFKGDPRVDMKYLSMGMTNDYELAIEEGSNMLRIGSAIFKN